MPKMRVVQIPAPTVLSKSSSATSPNRRPGSVRIKVQACGICHSELSAFMEVFRA